MGSKLMVQHNNLTILKGSVMEIVNLKFCWNPTILQSMNSCSLFSLDSSLKELLNAINLGLPTILILQSQQKT